MLPNFDSRSGRRVSVSLKANGGPAELGQMSGVPFETPSTETMQCGHAYYWDDFALDSEESGLTVWSIASGHGAFFNKDGFHPF